MDTMLKNDIALRGRKTRGNLTQEIKEEINSLLNRLGDKYEINDDTMLDIIKEQFL